MRKKVFLFGLLLFFVISGKAQIEGNVVDSTYKIVPDAIIIAIDTVKNIADTVKSDKQGFFAYKKLKKGTYKIVAKANGFQNTIYENVVVNNETPADHSESSDISSAAWLEIVLKPLKGPAKK